MITTKTPAAQHSGALSSGTLGNGPPRRAWWHPTDGLSWLWLALGAVTIPFSNLQTLVPIATWIGPVLLLRFTRTRRARVALPALVAAMCGGILLGMRDGFFPLASGLGYALFVAGLGLGATVPYAVDRLLVSRCHHGPALWSSHWRSPP